MGQKRPKMGICTLKGIIRSENYGPGTWYTMHILVQCFAWMKGLPNASDNKTGREWDEYGEVMHE